MEVTSQIELAKLLSQSELARLLKVSHRTLETWRRRGGGPPFVRVGAKLARYRPDDVERWLTTNTR